MAKKNETLPEKVPTENFRLKATGSKGQAVTVIVCGAADAFEGAKVLAVLGSEDNMFAVLRGIDSDRLARELGVVFDDEDEW